MSHGNDGWASPTPAGLLSLIVACVLFFAMYTGKITAPGALPIMGCWLLGAFIVQLSVGLIELKSGVYLGGNVFLVFSSFFCLASGIEMFVKYNAILNKLPIDSRADGWAFLAILICLLPITICYMKKAPLSFILLVFSLLAAAGVLVGLDLKLIDHHTYAPICGWLFMLSAFFAFYTMAAMFLNTTFEKVVLPMGNPLIK